MVFEAEIMVDELIDWLAGRLSDGVEVRSILTELQTFFFRTTFLLRCNLSLLVTDL